MDDSSVSMSREASQTIRERSVWRIIARLAFVLFIAFVVTPGFCVLGWLMGYGPGGMNELNPPFGYPCRWILEWSAFFSPIHFLMLLAPKEPNAKIFGYIFSIALILLSSAFWSLSAAGIASV